MATDPAPIDVPELLSALGDVDDMFRALADAVPAIIWVDDRSRRCIYVNAAWRTTLGRDRSEALGDGWAGGVHPEDRERFDRAWQSAFDAREPFAMEYRLRRADGSYALVNDQAIPRIDRDDRFLGYVGAALDVTAQHQAEADLRVERDRSRRATKRVRSIQRVTAALSAAASPKAVADVVVHGLKEASARAGYVALLSADRRRLEVVAAVGDGDELPRADLAGAAPAAEAVRSREPVVDGSRAWVPLLDADESVGVIAARHADDGNFDAEELAMLETLAHQGSQAMRRALLFEAERTRAARTEALQRLAAALAAAVTPAEVGGVLVELGADALGARAGLVGVTTDDASVEIVSSWGLPEGILEAVRVTPASEHYPGNDVIAQGRPMLFGDVPSIIEAYPSLRPTGGPVHEEAWATFPMMVGTEPIGFLHFSYREAQAFDDAQVGELTTVVAQAAQAMDRARSFAREQAVSRTLQDSLLSEPDIDTQRVVVASRYLPGAMHADVGGDWFDVLPLPGDRMALVVGDVVGRGVEAAAAMGQLRSAVRALALQGLGPAGVLEGLDRFASATPGARSATVAYVDLHLGTGVVRYACAGHPPPMIRRASRVDVLLQGRSALIGSDGHGARGEARSQIAPGDALVLYTDGLIERRTEPIDTGIDRLAATLVSLGDADPDAICDRTVAGLIADGQGSDDIALLCVLLRPTDEHTLHLSVPPEPSRLAKVREGLTSWMHRLGGAPERTELVVAAVNEAVANAIEHGSEGGLDIVVEGSLEGDRAVIVVRDAGRWSGSPSARRGEEQDEGAGGRGLALMHALVDEVEVRPGPGGTAVVLRHRVLDA